MSRWTNLSNKSFKWNDSSDSLLSKELLLPLTTLLPNKIVVLEILHIWLPCRTSLMQHKHRISVSETQLLVAWAFSKLWLCFSPGWIESRKTRCFLSKFAGTAPHSASQQRNAPATRCLQGPHLPASHAYQSGPPRLCLACSRGPPKTPTRLRGWGPGPCRIARPLVPPTHAWWAKSIMTGFTSKGRPCEARLPHNWRSRFRAEIILIPLFFWIHDRVRGSRGSFLTAEASPSQPSAGVTSSRRICQIHKKKKNLSCDLPAAWVRARF